ncbi:RNase adapter RapZ [Candidatus Puniceispirillum sp.]|nr:RNase adapter RapZ [Candidatus Puniceispirillum sp.]
MSKVVLTIKVVLVTGVSGAGHSTALKILEDYGFTAVDNLPLALVDPLIALEVEAGGRSIAIGLDARTSGFGAEAVTRLVQNLANRLGNDFKMVFISAGHLDLMRRYNATRRQHPLGQGCDLDLAIRSDMARMDDVEALADIVIDSSGLSPADLRHSILNSLQLGVAVPMRVNVLSFSYRHGLPETADQIFDMRFAKNPYWNDDLRGLTGLDKDVVSFFAQDELANRFLFQLQQMLRLMLGRIKEEGRPNFTLAFGCTGGKHRSVWAAAKITKWIQGQGFPVQLDHRELKEVVV